MINKRKLVAMLFSHAPDSVVHKYLRNHIDLPYSLPEDITFKIAETKEELEAAFMLLHDVYLESGFIEPQASGLYLIPQNAFPSTGVLIALKKSEVVGTVRLVRNNPLGLPMEKIFNLDSLKQQGGRIVEISGLAIKKSERRSSNGSLFFPLIKFLYHYLVDYFGTDYAVNVVYPRHAHFYKALFGYEDIEGNSVKQYCRAPAVALKLELTTLARRLYAIYGNVSRNRDMPHFFFEHQCPNFVFPKRTYYRISDPVMSPELIRYFFREKTDLFEKLSEEGRKKLFHYHNYVFGCDHSSGCPGEPEKGPSENEAATPIVAMVKDKETDSILSESNIEDLSFVGFHARFSRDLPENSQLFIKIRDDRTAAFAVDALHAWGSRGKRYGFLVKKRNDTWTHLLNSLMIQTAWRFEVRCEGVLEDFDRRREPFPMMVNYVSKNSFIAVAQEPSRETDLTLNRELMASIRIAPFTVAKNTVCLDRRISRDTYRFNINESCIDWDEFILKETKEIMNYF